MQGVERMEELFLGSFFTGKELDIVNEKHVDLAVLVAEALTYIVADRINELVGEFLG
ncbi:hypothetical protein D3C71_2226680 [compost metagenome]